MATILDVLNNFKRLKLRNQVKRMVESDFNEQIIALNQRQLYAQSVDSNGEPLSFYKSVSYSLEKEKRNPLPGFGRPDLYDTGSFFRNFVVRSSNSLFTITSTDSKTNKLTAKYGKDIFGLTKESKEEFTKTTLYRGIERYIESTTGIKML